MEACKPPPDPNHDPEIILPNPNCNSIGPSLSVVQPPLDIIERKGSQKMPKKLERRKSTGLCTQRVPGKPVYLSLA